MTGYDKTAQMLNVPRQTNFRPSAGGRFRAAFDDLVGGAKRWRLWTAFAWADLKTTYRRSIFGVLWIAISFSAFIFVKLIIFIPLIAGGTTTDFSVYLTAGFFVWQYISMVMNTSPTTFTSAEAWIRNDPIELSVFVYKAVFRGLFDLALTGVVAAAFMLYFSVPLTWAALMVIPALLALVVNAIWVQLFLGVLATRYRDVTHLIPTVMRVLFFLTPIFWMPAQLGGLWPYLWWNPFTHFILILR